MRLRLNNEFKNVGASVAGGHLRHCKKGQFADSVPNEPSSFTRTRKQVLFGAVNTRPSQEPSINTSPSSK